MENGTETTENKFVAPPEATERMSDFSNELVVRTLKFAEGLGNHELSDNVKKDEVLLGFTSALNILMLVLIDDHKERVTRAKNIMQAVLTNLEKFKEYENEKKT